MIEPVWFSHVTYLILGRTYKKLLGSKFFVRDLSSLLIYENRRPQEDDPNRDNNKRDVGLVEKTIVHTIRVTDVFISGYGRRTSLPEMTTTMRKVR